MTELELIDREIDRRATAIRESLGGLAHVYTVGSTVTLGAVVVGSRVDTPVVVVLLPYFLTVLLLYGISLIREVLAVGGWIEVLEARVNDLSKVSILKWESKAAAQGANASIFLWLYLVLLLAGAWVASFRVLDEHFDVWRSWHVAGCVVSGLSLALAFFEMTRARTATIKTVQEVARSG